MKAEASLLAQQSDIDEDGREPEDAEAQQDKLLEKAREIINGLQSKASAQIRARANIETRWLEDLRSYYGRYDDKTEASLQTEERSQAFIKLTRHKTNGWAARLQDLLFPTDGRNWGIEPTPIPLLAQAAKDALAAAQESVEGANAAEQAGNPEAAAMMKEQADAYAGKVRQTEAEIEEAHRRCKGMQEAIEDQLVEARYAVECRDVIEDGCRIGTGILKGPLTSNRLRREWRKSAALGGRFVLATIPDPMPEAKRVDPWHFFPDNSAQRISDAEFTFERHMPTKRDLRRMALKLGFSKAAVGRLIAEGAPQYAADMESLSQLREMAGEGEAVKDRYVMWEYHGALECDEVALLLRAAGDEEEARAWEEEKDPFDEYRVILYFCQDELLKIEAEYPLDSGESMYSVWTFERGETSIWGIGVPRVMMDSQGAINSAWRMMLDNSALSVGPQIVIDKDQIQPQAGQGWGLKPMKVWLRSSTALAKQTPPFEVHNIPNNQQALSGIIELGKLFVDEETSMPNIAQGEQGAASKTLGGMSMLFNSANVVFRRVVKSFDDDLTTPTLRRFYDWNMQFNPDASIKGDMQVDARGTSVLLVREIQSQNLLNIVTNWSVHQVLGGWLKPRELMAKALETMMIPVDEVLLSQDKYDQQQRKLAESQGDQGPTPDEVRLQVAQISADARLKAAQIESEVRMAELQERSGLTREQVAAKYQIDLKKLESGERQKAVDIAVEDRRAAEAVKAGGSKVEAQGQGIG